MSQTPSTSSARPLPEVGKGHGNKGKDKAPKESDPSPAPYNFMDEEEELIATWIRQNPLLYDMRDRRYKDKGSRRKMWEDKAAQYGIDCKFNLIIKSKCLKNK